MDLEERRKTDGKRMDERGQDKESRLGWRIFDDDDGGPCSIESVLGSTMILDPRTRPQESTLVRHNFSFH